MQEAPTTSHTWTELVGYGLATITTSIAVLNAWKNRKKPTAEIHESEARTELARAQATQTVAQTLQTISVQLKEARESIQALETKLDRRLEEIALLELQVQRARAAGFLAERLPHSPNPAA
jgi:uncharacterized protein YjiS (DUF1127 family)